MATGTNGLMHDLRQAAAPATAQAPHAPQALLARAQQRHIDSIDAIKALAAADGNAAMAAKLLGLQGADGEATVLAAIVTDETSHEIMARYLRAMATMKVFGLIGAIHDTLMDDIGAEAPSISTGALARLLPTLLSSLGSLTEQREGRLLGNRGGSRLVRGEYMPGSQGAPGGGGAGGAGAFDDIPFVNAQGLPDRAGAVAQEVLRVVPPHIRQALTDILEAAEAATGNTTDADNDDTGHNNDSDE